jgi:hypothetical protein
MEKNILSKVNPISFKKRQGLLTEDIKGRLIENPLSFSLWWGCENRVFQGWDFELVNVLLANCIEKEDSLRMGSMPQRHCDRGP